MHDWSFKPQPPPLIPPPLKTDKLPQYYRMDSTKLTCRELWDMAPWGIFIWLPAKLMRKQLPFGSGIPFNCSQREMEKSEQDLPEEVKSKLKERWEECLQNGFHSPRFFHLPTRFGESRTWFIGMMHSSGLFCLRLFCTISIQPNLRLVATTCAIITQFTDGRYLVTTSYKRTLAIMPELTVNRIINGRPTALLRLHEKRLKSGEFAAQPRLITTPEELDAFSDEYEKRSTDFQMKRGVYVMMTDAELSAAESRRR